MAALKFLALKVVDHRPVAKTVLASDGGEILARLDSVGGRHACTAFQWGDGLSAIANRALRRGIIPQSPPPWNSDLSARFVSPMHRKFWLQGPPGIRLHKDRHSFDLQNS